MVSKMIMLWLAVILTVNYADAGSLLGLGACKDEYVQCPANTNDCIFTKKSSEDNSQIIHSIMCKDAKGNTLYKDTKTSPNESGAVVFESIRSSVKEQTFGSFSPNLEHELDSLFGNFGGLDSLSTNIHKNGIENFQPIRNRNPAISTSSTNKKPNFKNGDDEDDVEVFDV